MLTLTRALAIAFVALAVLLSACTTPIQERDSFSGLGVVQSIQETQRTSSPTNAVGAAGKGGLETVWQVNIRSDDGINRAFTVTERPTYRPGDPVRVDNGAVFPMAAK